MWEGQLRITGNKKGDDLTHRLLMFIAAYCFLFLS
jgi:hypothetical protein